MTTTMELTDRQPQPFALLHLVTGSDRVGSLIDIDTLVPFKLLSGTAVLMGIAGHVAIQEQETPLDRWPIITMVLDNQHLPQVRSRTRMRQQFIKRLETVNSLYECEQECLNERTFKCLSFNYM